jgi:hypothetical protein
VTSLGEFSPVDRFFSLGSFFESYNPSKIFGTFFFLGKKQNIFFSIFTIFGLGKILGDFFTISSGHPGWLSTNKK